MVMLWQIGKPSFNLLNSQLLFTIDYGDKFDAAVASLCLNLKIPLVMGGTFAVSLTVDFFNPVVGEPCYLCLDDTAKNYPSLSSISPDNIL